MKTNMVVKRGSQWCVVHGHPQKPGSKTDKPEGTVIKCFPTKAQADAMHRAIMANERRENMNENERGKGKGVGGPQQGDGGTDTCVCPECGTTAKHNRGTPCADMTCSKCGTKMAGQPTTNEGLNSLKHLMSNLVRREQLEGVDFYVVPTILLVEGVHSGLDNTPTYYPNSELAKFPAAWNGRPIVVMHPDLDGHAVTASSPELLERQTVGNLYHCKFENNKLKGESWININKCRRISPEVMDMLEKNQPIEVSTGLFVESEIKDGVWNNEKYENTVYNFRPDHLALLPGGIGACSWQDGAGMPRLNAKGKEENDGSMISLIKKLASLVGVKTQIPNVLELSHGEIRRVLVDMLVADKSFPSRGDAEVALYIVEVFDKYAIYEIEGKTRKQAYSIDAKDAIELVGDSVEVQKEVTYVPVEQNVNLQKKENKKGGEKIMKREEKVKALIANGSWGEDAKEFLMGLEDPQFEVIEKISLNQKVEKKEGEKVEVVDLEAMLKAEPAADETELAKVARKAYNEAIGANSKKVENAEVKPQTVEDFIANAPAEMQETLGRSVKRDKAIKIKLVEGLMGNKRNEFSKEALEVKSLAELESLAKLGQVEVDFGGKNPAINSDDEDKPPEMARMEWGGKKEEKEDKE